MDKNVHLTDKNERARKIYRVKMMTGKQRHLKAKKEQSSFLDLMSLYAYFNNIF